MAPISKKHLTILKILIYTLSFIRVRREKRKRYRKGRMWVAPHIKERDEQGAFQNVLPGLRERGEEVYHDFYHL